MGKATTKVKARPTVDSPTLADMLTDYSVALRVMSWLADREGSGDAEPKILALEFAASSKGEREALEAALAAAVDDTDC